MVIIQNLSQFQQSVGYIGRQASCFAVKFGGYLKYFFGVLIKLIVLLESVLYIIMWVCYFQKYQLWNMIIITIAAKIGGKLLPHLSRVAFIHPNPSCKQKTGHVIHDRLSAISQILNSFSLSRCIYNNFSCHFITMWPDEVYCCL